MTDLEAGFWIEQRVLPEAECDVLIVALAQTSTKRGRAESRHATLFEKSGEVNWLIAWHQDTALSLASHFDAPGWSSWSQKEGVVYAHAPNWALSRILALRVHLDASTSRNGPLRVIPGSHASGVLTDEGILEYVREDPRRVLHIEYAESLDLGPDIRLAVA